MRILLGAAAAGLAAGILNGFFGGGGGMILIPALSAWCHVEERELFPTSVSIMLPICVMSLWISSQSVPLPWSDALPYLVGSATGGILVGLLGRKIPMVWLHRILGVMLLWGGIRYLW